MHLVSSRLPHKSLIPVVLGLIIRLVNINKPIVGVHSWRQADTAAMARHFFLENTPIWLPQIDWAGSTQGYVESEFPIYPFIVAQIYKVFGLYEIYGRLISIVFGLLTILLIIRITTILFNSRAGFWAGIFYSIIPLCVYYSRTFQAESLLLLLSSLSIERLLVWRKKEYLTAILISFTSFTLACLIKVLPLIWLGLPLLFISAFRYEYKSIMPLKTYLKPLVKNLFSRGTILFISISLLILISWYLYSYNLGLESGLSFGFWGESSDRGSVQLIFSINAWLNLLIRIIIRNLSIFGLPILIYVLAKYRGNHGVNFCIVGIIGVFTTTILSMRSSIIHEYYQLPLQLYFSPLIGHGIASLETSSHYIYVRKHIAKICIFLLITVSLIVLNYDYFAFENRQQKIWMPLAYEIRNSVPIGGKIVSATDNDPTLLNLSRRQGWLTSLEDINEEKMQLWRSKGAIYIVGSLEWKNSYTPNNDKSIISKLDKYFCKSQEIYTCPKLTNYLYKIPLNEIRK